MAPAQMYHRFVRSWQNVLNFFTLSHDQLIGLPLQGSTALPSLRKGCASVAGCHK